MLNSLIDPSTLTFKVSYMSYTLHSACITVMNQHFEKLIVAMYDQFDNSQKLKKQEDQLKKEIKYADHIKQFELTIKLSQVQSDKKKATIISLYPFDAYFLTSSNSL